MESDERACPRCAETIKLAASVCRHCGYDFEQPVPKPPRKRKRWAVGCLVAFVLLATVSTCAINLAQTGSNIAATPFSVDGQLASIHDKVARDAVAQYQIAAQSGAPMDRCVQAGLVAAAFLQAQDQASYAQWKDTERRDCKAAGLRR